MPHYRGWDGREIPTGPGDPKAEFFADTLKFNCYAYAVNLVRIEIPSINPGELGPEGTLEAQLWDSNLLYQTACEADGLVHVGRNPAAYLDAPGGYLIAFLKSHWDMHWKRRDSQGTWSEKFPQGLPERCKPQDPTDDTKNMEFIAYYWVRPEVVKLRAMIKPKSKVKPPPKSFCIIL
jgi:hypothetical protein